METNSGIRQNAHLRSINIT